MRRKACAPCSRSASRTSPERVPERSRADLEPRRGGRPGAAAVAAIVAVAVALGALLVAAPADAQPVGKVARIGYLALDLTHGDPRPREAFLQALRELGYVEGRDVAI